MPDQKDVQEWAQKAAKQGPKLPGAGGPSSAGPPGGKDKKKADNAAGGEEGGQKPKRSLAEISTDIRDIVEELRGIGIAGLDEALDELESAAESIEGVMEDETEGDGDDDEDAQGDPNEDAA